jgi:hypothetical protein
MADNTNPAPVCANAQIAQDYQTILGRAPDAGGLAFWQNAAASGESLACIQNAFYNSPEYQAKVAAAPQPQPNPNPMAATGGLAPSPAPAPQPNPTPMAATGGLGYVAAATTPSTQGPTPAQQEQTYLANVPGVNVCSWNQMVQASAQPGYHPTPFGPQAQSSAYIQSPMTQAEWAQSGTAQVPGNTYQQYLSEFNQPISPILANITGTNSTTPMCYGLPTCHPVNPVVACETNQITQDYQQILGRAPDPSGFAFWQTAARNGVPMSQIMAEIAASPEAQALMDKKKTS